MQPLIGIPCVWVDPTPDHQSPRFASNQSYARAVAAAGGLPVLLPLLTAPDLLHSLYDRLDGVLLSGGHDVHSSHFGEEVHPKTVPVPPASDEVELTLARWAIE